jgi:glycosyltransferase involved in cell wall biosynthesis
LPKKLKIFRVTTKPMSLNLNLKGQLRFINRFFDVVAVSTSGKQLNEFKKIEKVKIAPLNMTRKISVIKDVVSLFKMIKLIIKEQPFIIHSHTPKAGFISMLASAICRVPHRLHSVAGLPLMEAKGLKKLILIFVEWLTYKCATKVYPVSFGLEKYILKKIRISRSKIKVIGPGSSNGVDIKYYKKNKKINKLAINFKKKLLLKNKFLFIFIGRVVKDKGIEELLESFTKLNKKYKNSRLLILGWEEKHLDPISKKAKNYLTNNKNIIYLGFKRDIRPYLVASNCLVLPTYREGFPNVILQAGSMGVPSIATNINGCNEVIANKVNGLLVKPKNTQSLYSAMKKILTDKKLYSKFKKSSRETIIKRYSKGILLNEILLTYLNLSKNKLN